MTILALDLATTTGWAICREGDITSGTKSFKNDRYSGGGMRFLKFSKFMYELKELSGFKEVVFEEVRRHIGVDAAHAYGGFLATLSAWCEQNNTPYQGVPVGTIKKFISGKGNASKQEVIQAIKEKGHMPKDDNEADALALLYWRINNEKNI